MAPLLKISSCFIQKLDDVKIECVGCLYGIMYNGNLLVIGFKSNVTDENLKIPFTFATEVDLCGVISFGNANITDTNATDIFKEVDITDNPLLLNCSNEHHSNLSAYFYIHGKLEKTSYEIVNDQEILKEFLHIRLQTRIPLTCEWSADSVKEAFSNLHKKAVGGGVSFHFPKTGVYLLGNDTETGFTGTSGEPLVGELCDHFAEQSEGVSNSRNKKILNLIDMLTVEMFWKPTKDTAVDEAFKHAPLINYNRKNFQCLQVHLMIDSLALVYRKSKILNLYNILVESLCRNLKLIEQSLEQQLLENESQVTLPVPYHVLPEECGYFITLVYPKGTTDKDLEDQRRLLHDQFFLPVIKPYFRRKNAYRFKNDIIALRKLINPHEGLTATVKNGDVSVVKGKYIYYHYMQDQIDDDGWGCAYRSLQTICSWFWWQGYTEKRPPTHKEIQECLVKIGDKPSSFINSKQWIGSTEVSFCLETLLGVTSRIINVSSGEEMANQGPTLATHFKKIGTPIMIGGGVLAHTILGVDYNKATGELRFLILDPHYKGIEDLQQVQTKGWCAWKNCDFWKKGAYYNMCLPQLPYCI